MREAQQETMTQTCTVMQNPNSGPINAISKDLSADLGRSLASASPSEPLPNQPKLRAKNLDIERPDSCSGRPARETLADLVQVTGELVITRQKKEVKTNMIH